MSSEPRPLRWLRELTSKYPDAWKTLEAFRAARGSRPELSWPNWVYVPVAGAFAVVFRDDYPLPSDPRAFDVARVAGIGAWRMTKGIYRFDPLLFEELWASEYEGPITLDPLRHLPEWSVYVEIPARPALGGEFQLHGFFAFLEHDMNSGHEELNFLWDMDDPDGKPALLSTVLHLGEPTLQAAFEAGAEEGREVVRRLDPGYTRELEELHGADLEELNRKSIELNMEIAKHALSLLLFLIASGDVRPTRPDQPTKPHRPQPKKTRKGVRLLAANALQTWDVGVRYGRLLAARQPTANAERGRGAPKRPHVRRAHWHGYWVGPRSKPEERRLELRWLPPIFVGAKAEEELPAVIWKVRDR